MKKIVRFMKRYYKEILIVMVVFICYGILHDIATAERNYEAIGGEIFVFLLPYMGYMAYLNIKDTVKAMKNNR